MGCQKDNTSYIPEIEVSSNKTQGLTTDVFSFTVKTKTEKPQNEKVHCRWDWDGDSIFDTKYSDDLEVKHRFYKPGAYTILCEALSISGGQSVESITISIEQGYSSPKALFEVVPETGHFKTDFFFDARVTIDDEDSLETLRFRWDFNSDGVWDTEFSEESTICHTFDRIGIKDVSLEVIDPSKRAGSINRTIEVHKTDTCLLPLFTWNAETGRVGDIFTFDASKSRHRTDPDKELKFKWFFPMVEYTEDTTGAIIEHKFLYPGLQTVKLVIEDRDGLMNSIEEEIYVSSENVPPRAKIITPTNSGNVETQFYLNTWECYDDYTPSSQLKVRWDFDGDGNWDTEQTSEREFYHQYPEEGKYTCIIEVEDEEGLTSEASTVFWVSPYHNPTSWIYDRRDGNYYGTVQIGNTWWMSDNLDYRDNIKMGIPMIQKCYDEDPKMCDIYGSLYQNERVYHYIKEGNKICPDGWRLPAKEEMEELSSLLPASNSREAVMRGGSLDFNGIYSGYGTYSFVYDILGRIVDTVYSFHNRDIEGYVTSSDYLPQFRVTNLQFTRESPEAWVFHYPAGFRYYPIRCVKEE